MNKGLIKQIEEWLKDYELATGEPYGDADTLDGSAYILLGRVLGMLKKR